MPTCYSCASEQVYLMSLRIVIDVLYAMYSTQSEL